MKRISISVVLACAAAAVLTGCANPDYQAYAKAHEAAQVERSKALSTIAESGSETTKVAATMALTFGAQSGLQAPRDAWDRVLQALGIIAPVWVQDRGIQANKAISINQSNNALATSKDQNATMLGFGGLINAPVVVEQPAPIIVTQPPPLIVTPEVVQPTIVQVPVAAQ